MRSSVNPVEPVQERRPWSSVRNVFIAILGGTPLATGCGADATPPAGQATQAGSPSGQGAGAPQSIQWGGIDSGYKGQTVIGPDGTRAQR
jgi:hypothetical protein